MSLRSLGFVLTALQVASFAAQPEARELSTEEFFRDAQSASVHLLVVDPNRQHRRFGLPAFEAAEVGAAVALSRSQRVTLSGAMQENFDRGPEAEATKLCMFHPDVSVELQIPDGARIKAIFCFSCDDLVIVKADGTGGVDCSVSYARQELVRFFQSLFPADPRWKKLSERPNQILDPQYRRKRDGVEKADSSAAKK